jgi:hypothetical protein
MRPLSLRKRKKLQTPLRLQNDDLRINMADLLHQELKWVRPFSFDLVGGEGGIRTHEAFHRLSVFKTDAIDHYATSPNFKHSKLCDELFI